MNKPTKPGNYRYRVLYVSETRPGPWVGCELTFDDDGILRVVHDGNLDKAKPLSQYANLIEWEEL